MIYPAFLLDESRSFLLHVSISAGFLQLPLEISRVQAPGRTLMLAAAQDGTTVLW